MVEEDGSVSKGEASLPLKALVRVRIPLNRPVIKENHGSNDNSRIEGDHDDLDQDNDTNRSRSRIDTNRSQVPLSQRDQQHQQLSTHPDEDTTNCTEQPIEDRVYLINTVSQGDNARIWVMHQAASRVLRKDMATVLKKSLKELDNIELDDFLHAVESHAVEVEKNFVKMFSSEETKEFDQIRAKYHQGSNAPIATFDFELN